MYWSRSIADIVHAWDAEIAVKLETGATPLLVGGAPSAALPTLPGLTALQILAAHRTDVTLPLVPIGGSSPVWLGYLLAAQTADAAPRPRDPIVIFAGADPATVQATLATAAVETAAPALGATIPAHIAVEMAPHLVPGAAVGWEALPFLAAGERLPLAAAEAAPDAQTAVDWAAWGALLLALCLVLSAVLI